MASHHLHTPSELKVEDSLVSIHVTQDESFAIVGFQSGLICVYDAKNSFQFIGLVEKDAQRFSYSNQLDL